MNAIRRIHDRLTGVLGRDCQGKPLRKGDRVVAVVNVKPEYQGLEAEVVGPYVPSDVSERNTSGKGPWVELSGRCCSRASSLKRVDFDEDASWDRTAEITGWKPSTVTRPGEVPV